MSARKRYYRTCSAHSCHGSHEHDVREFEKKCLWHKLPPRLGRTSILWQGMHLCSSWKRTIFGSFRGNTALLRNVFIACSLTVHTSEHHVLGCHIRLCHRICSIVCTGLYVAKRVFEIQSNIDVNVEKLDFVIMLFLIGNTSSYAVWRSKCCKSVDMSFYVYLLSHLCFAQKGALSHNTVEYCYQRMSYSVLFYLSFITQFG